MERWQNKVAVVTGAVAGIGAAVTRDLLVHGMIVVGLDIQLNGMVADIKATLTEDQQHRFHAICCDVRKEDDILKAFAWVEKTLGGVDVLVNNAGVVRNIKLISPNNSSDLRDILDTNLFGVAICTREACRSMKKRGVDGHIIMMNSLVGHIVPQFFLNRSFNMYAPTKHAMTAMTEVLRQELLNDQTNIKVTSISPGIVRTDIIPFPKDFAALSPKDVADAVNYCLATPPNVQIHELIMKPIGEKV